MTKVTVYINDKPATWDKCHSEIEVEDRESAIALLWFLAHQETPEFGCIFTGESWTNLPMQSLAIPEKFKEKVEQWKIWFEHCTPINGNPAEGMEDIIVDALNDKFDALMEYSDLDPQIFIRELTHYANRWARDCYQDAPHLY